ncbi:MAG: Na(+)-translocating NADH-quinone reductase subunit A [Saprospiraceae bacterium]|nr:Na(+)-translocating NADH-quinone reductase subunit A [Saprospiraceae bacterium]
MNKLVLTMSLTFLANLASSQSKDSDSDLLIYGLTAVCLVLVIWAMLALASNLMKIEAAKNGLDEEKNNFSVFPGLNDLFKPKKPSFVTEGSFHKLKSGFDINLEGSAKGPVQTVQVTRYALKPTDFFGMSPIPKVTVEVGAEVKAGDILFFDKKKPEVQYASPVSGEVVDILRGEKRSIAQVVILSDKKMSYTKYTAPDIQKVDRETLVAFMMSCGLWPLINERPYDVVPAATTIPVNIFVSTFDTAPLAPDSSLIIQGNETAFQKGLDVLVALTSGKVHLGLDARGAGKAAAGFVQAKNVEKHWFSGPHPAGNVGVHIHHVAPIKTGDKVWTLGVQEVVTIGQMFLKGEYHAERIVAITGAELLEPKYVKTYQGASIADLIKGNIKEGNNRVISGDVLSGKQTEVNGFLGFRDDQITVVKEGNEYELFGWLLPLAPRPSISGTIPSFGKDHKFEANTNTHGEKRAFVVSGQYESVLPMDIYPQHLMKAILTNNIEKMEGLGLAELTEEDIALCEFVCTSKNPLQSILRQGLETLKTS